MTECERILSKNEGFPADFLQEEVRCEFTVTEQLKKVWMVLLDLALELDKICEKYGLTYYLIGGSMLGAVRHKGFIPWDDDMDIGMPRKDYETLLSHGDEFSAPYFLQTPYTEPAYAYSFAKLRNSNTTACTRNFAWQPMNQGIALDIFPLDPWVPEEGEPLYNEVLAICLDSSNYMRRLNPYLDEAGQARAAAWSGRSPQENFERIKAIAQTFSDRPCEYLSHAVITVDKYPNNYFPLKDFRQIIRVPFENFMLPIPAGYDDFLTREYGDYMSFPPVSDRGIKHSEFYLDPDMPYKDYLRTIGAL